MKANHTIIVLFLLCVSASVWSQNDVSPIDSAKIITHEDSIRYEFVKDSLGLSRTGSVGDNMQNPIQAGTYSTDFQYSNTRITHAYTNQYGRYTNDVFHRLVLTVPMNVTFTHEGSELSDTYMHLLDSNGNLIDYDDDYSGEGHCSSTLHSFIRRQLAAGTYYVVSEGYSSDGEIRINITGNASTGFNYPVIPSAYSAESNSVGAMGVSFGVSPLGGATYNIPIEVPQGVNGHQPNIAITYNSQAGNGICGYGTSISGLSSITRGPKNIYHDGAAYGMGYYADDAFYLDGVRLVLYSGTAGQDGAIYYPESDPFTQVKLHGTCYTSINYMWFEIINQAGTKMWYGYSTGRHTYTVGGNQKTMDWYVDYMEDPFGNEMTISYETVNNVIYPASIVYGMNNRSTNNLRNYVYFNYEDRDDVTYSRFDGVEFAMDQRLESITTKTGNTIFRTYILNYNTIGDGTAYKFSRLTSVTEKNGYDETLPATQLTWSYLPEVNYNSNPLNLQVMYSMDNTLNDPNYASCDLNHDGISDIIVYGKSNNSNDHHLYLYEYMSERTSTGTINFTDTVKYSITPSYSSISGDYSNYFYQALSSSGIGGSTSIDYDGDGNNELMIGHRFRSLSGDIFTGDTIENYIEFFMIGYDYINHCRTMLSKDCLPLYAVGDIDNNGTTDIVVLETSYHHGNYAKLHILSTIIDPSYYTYNYANLPISNSLDFDLYIRGIPKRIFLSDMNGNGLTDMLIIYSNGYDILWNTGGSINSFNSLFVNGSTNNTDHYHGTTLQNYWMVSAGDFNGDGLLDIFTNEYANTSSNTWYFYINNGNGIFSKSLATTLNDYIYLNSDKCNCSIFDFDGDGKTDVVITASNIPNSYLYTTYTYWMRSNGTSLVQEDHASSFNVSDASYNRYITDDFDGDGRIELVNYGYDCVGSENSSGDPVWRIYKNSSLTVQSGKVTSVKGDFGATTSITYSTLADQNVYTRGTNTPYPAPKYTIPLNVVKRTVENNGAAGSLTTNYSYSDLRIHLQGKGVLGFCSAESNNTTLGIASSTTVTGWNSTFYIPSSVQTKTTIGNAYSQQTTTLTIVNKGLPNTTQKLFFAYPSQTVDRDFDANLVTTIRDYDTSHGYLNSESSSYGSGMYRSTVYSGYVTAGRAYRPGTIVSKQCHPDDGNEFSITTTNTYNATTGALTQSVEGSGNNNALTTNYTYTTFGYIYSKSVTGTGIGSYVQYYGYDATKRFLTLEYSSPSAYVMEYTYDTWGNRLTETDNSNSAYPITVNHEYDHWGNLMRTQIPGSGETTYSRGWNYDNASKRFFILTQGTGCPWVKTWYDNKGREVQTETIGPKNISVLKSTSYNSKGLTSVVSETTGNLTLSHSYSYDSRGRLTNEVHPGHGSISYTYGSDGLTTTVNDNSRQTIYTYDLMGMLKQVDDPVSGCVKNEYSSNGGITETEVNGAVWEMGYDALGNRTSLKDPDAGTTTYTFDALGRERTRTDARGVVFVTNYDYLGRITSTSASKSGNTETITYTYGTSGTGKLRLVEKTLGSWTNSYEYDQYGRMITENEGGHTATFEYNPAGLVSRMSWLSGGYTDRNVSYTYDAYGNCITKNALSGAIHWDLTGYTGTTTTSTMMLHSNVYLFTKTTTTDSNGNLSSNTLVRNNSTLSAASYTFSSTTSNLTSRTLGGTTQTFAYDNADRLTTVQQNNQNVMSMTYGSNGNILSKTGVGAYDYNSSKPHAVAAVDNTSGLIPEGTQSVTYNLWGKVSEVNAVVGSDTYRYELTYGPDLQRVLAVLWKNDQLVHLVTYGHDFEEKYLGSHITRYYYVSGTDGNAAVYISDNSTGDKAYCMDMDHLGSIIGLYDQYGTKCYGASFDPWGKRTLMSGSIEFDRGFTGHEHIDEINLIDMNGRMYDPLLGRFLSVDPFVQAPTNPQNFNRYSYCLNNPLKYTDPDGEIVWMPIIIGAAMGGISGYMIGSEANASGWDMVGYVAGGAVLGALSSGISQGMAALGASPFVTQLTTNAVTSTLSSGMMSGWDGRSMLIGFASGLVSGGISGALSFSYDPVGMINGMLADGAVNAGIGAISGGITSYIFDGDFGEGALNGAISGALSGMAFGAYRGWTNAKTLGVNKWTGGTLQERAQAWANYYGLPGEMFVHASQKNLDDYVETRGKNYRYYSNYNGIGLSTDPRATIDGFCADKRDLIYLSGKTIRHARFNTGWGKGTFYHEHFHSLSEFNHKNEFGAYTIGYKYGGRSYYRHCWNKMKYYGIPR